ncbi:MAG TPA: class I SAM-dependent methyltransferase [Nakamurella sp.]
MTEPAPWSDFNAFEAAGWERAAAGYDAFLGPIARQFDTSLLDASGITAGRDLLEIGCGAAHLAAQAAARGARSAGIDVADSMLQLARTAHPEINTHLGSAEDLPFPDHRFDAVVGHLVILHLSRPELAAAEAFRVLRPGGLLVLSTWDLPVRNRFLGIMLEALDEAGAVPPSIPQGPPFFHYADDGHFIGLFRTAGFVDVSIHRLATTRSVPSSASLWNGLVDSTVRTAATLSSQPAEIRERALSALQQRIEPYATDDRYELPVSIKLASGRRP